MTDLDKGKATEKSPGALRRGGGSPLTTAALFIAAGLAIGGWLAGRGIVDSRREDRFVTVKGVSERDVRADLALWPLRYEATDDDLRRAQSQIEESRAKILEFLEANGIDPAAAVLQRMEVQDRVGRSGGGPMAPGSRFTVNQSLMIRSDDPEVVRAASQKVGDLVNAGVVLSSGGWSGGPTYLFTRLDDFKTEMIAEATAKARDAAAEFARDSGADLGGIRRANQGVFQVLARDRAPGVSEEGQLEKTLRVVSTVEWYLGE